MYPESARNFESNKILGGVGALLTAIGSLVLFRGAVGIVGVVGIILVLVSMRGLADDIKDYSIYKRATVGFVFGIIGIIIAIAVFAAFGFLSGFIFLHPVLGAFGYLVAIGAWFIMFIFLSLQGVFFKQSFDALAYRSGQRLFRTGGFLLFIGGILTIILVGFFLLFVGWILIAVAFFSMKQPMRPEQDYAPSPLAAIPTVSSSSQFKYCQYCGSENKIDGTFCTHCGRRLN
jgi:uncharacterized membrane protein